MIKLTILAYQTSISLNVRQPIVVGNISEWIQVEQLDFTLVGPLEMFLCVYYGCSRIHLKFYLGVIL